MQRWPFRPIATKKYFTKADAIDLPDYLAAVPNWVSGVIAMASNSPAPAAPQAIRAFPENAVSKVIYPGRPSAERECWRVSWVLQAIAALECFWWRCCVSSATPTPANKSSASAAP